LTIEFSKYLPTKPVQTTAKKDERFQIKEMAGPYYRFRESKSRLLLRKKNECDNDDKSADRADVSTAPTRKQLETEHKNDIEDSLDCAELNDLHVPVSDEKSVDIRRGRPLFT